MAIAVAPSTTGLDRFLETLAGDDRLVHLERLPARPARFGELARPLAPEVWDALGVDRLWSHQAEAIDLARDGTSVAVATGTASGKSLCYRAPIAEAVTQGMRTATALLLFPTKALAQDQLRALVEMDVPRLVAATYDGDTPPEARTWARGNANVLLTNPEMLHVGMPAASRAMGHLLHAAALRRDRRAAHAARHLRQPRRSSAAPSAASVRALRLRSHVHLLVGHHRHARVRWRRTCAASRSPRSPTTARRAASVCSCCGTRRSTTQAAARRPTARPPAWWPIW